MNVLLVEPDYRSKLPPLGLMRISTYHKDRGDSVTFARGKVPKLRAMRWHRVYVSSLFTYELPRTVETLKYYARSVAEPSDLVVGGIGVTLLPDYVRTRIECRIVEGQLDQPGKLEPGAPAIADLVPDYDLINTINWQYKPNDAYFCRATVGCIRRCPFCAVPVLEPQYRQLADIKTQIEAIRSRFGEKKDLIFLDNNILATEGFVQLIDDVVDAGFAKGAKLSGRSRAVDFNQGIDARLIDPSVAAQLARIALSPVRLAFDSESVEKPYRRAIKLLADVGFRTFTNYILFNFDDTPESLYRRLAVNLELSDTYGISITGFPMKYVPISDVHRKHIGKFWRWRYLRGIQCVLLATHGMVSPNPKFFEAAFGRSPSEFLEIVAMPDRYIIHREQYSCAAEEWREAYRRLSASERDDFMQVLATIHKARDREVLVKQYSKYQALLRHYYPELYGLRDH